MTLWNNPLWGDVWVRGYRCLFLAPVTLGSAPTDQGLSDLDCSTGPHTPQLLTGGNILLRTHTRLLLRCFAVWLGSDSQRVTHSLISAGEGSRSLAELVSPDYTTAQPPVVKGWTGFVFALIPTHSPRKNQFWSYRFNHCGNTPTTCPKGGGRKYKTLSQQSLVCLILLSLEDTLRPAALLNQPLT